MSTPSKPETLARCDRMLRELRRRIRRRHPAAKGPPRPVIVLTDSSRSPR